MARRACPRPSGQRPNEFFDVYDATFHHGPGEAWVFEVAPVTAYGFGKGEYSHTRWRFE
jgi:hypothetical protein